MMQFKIVFVGKSLVHKMGIEFANNITGTLSSVHFPKTKNDYLLTK